MLPPGHIWFEYCCLPLYVSLKINVVFPMTTLCSRQNALKKRWVQWNICLKEYGILNKYYILVENFIRSPTFAFPHTYDHEIVLDLYEFLYSDNLCNIKFIVGEFFILSRTHRMTLEQYLKIFTKSSCILLTWTIFVLRVQSVSGAPENPVLHWHIATVSSLVQVAFEAQVLDAHQSTPKSQIWLIIHFNTFDMNSFPYWWYI